MPPPVAALPAPVFGLLDPCNDFVFKALFVEKPALLLDLINAVRGHLPAIENIEILNPAIPPEALKGKAIVLDLLAREALPYFQSGALLRAAALAIFRCLCRCVNEYARANPSKLS